MSLETFTAELHALGQELRREADPADLVHYRRVAFAGRAATALGLATAWIAPNPVSVLGLALGRFARWTMIGHHVCHRGYDRVGGPKGKDFGEGARRFVDWFDWLAPDAWKHEHNRLHHYRLNEVSDPDLVEHYMGWLRESRLPMVLRYAVVLGGACTWRWTYYASSLFAAVEHGDADGSPDRSLRATLDPRTRVGAAFWRRSVLPFAGVQFVLLPALFLLISPWAALSVLVNNLLAELVTNLHAFAVVVPNHAGGDLYRFDTPSRGREDFYLRQVLGSTNFPTGGEVNDFLHGYLNYQIEHHLWPDLPMAAYRRAQPRVAEICARHGVPYVQQPVWRRLVRTVRVMVGQESMRVWEAEAGAQKVSGLTGSGSGHQRRTLAVG